MNEKEKSRPGLNNTGVVIAKCLNHNYYWEARIDDAITLDDVCNVYCPMYSKAMQGEIN